jgi:release factor glutamine methyltransferase
LHDPEIALFAGENGEQLSRELIAQAPAHMRAAGLLALEIGIGQSDSLAAFLAQKNFHDIESKKDYAGTPRFLLARYG